MKRSSSWLNRSLSCSKNPWSPTRLKHVPDSAKPPSASYPHRLGYGVAYMDRVNISFASLQMNRDCTSVPPSTDSAPDSSFLSYGRLRGPLQPPPLRFGARRWLARIMVTWASSPSP